MLSFVENYNAIFLINGILNFRKITNYAHSYRSVQSKRENNVLSSFPKCQRRQPTGATSRCADF